MARVLGGQSIGGFCIVLSQTSIFLRRARFPRPYSSNFFFVFNAILFSQAGVDPLAPTHDTKSAASSIMSGRYRCRNMTARGPRCLRSTGRRTMVPTGADWETLRKIEVPQ
jgi:hypothetical protein